MYLIDSLIREGYLKTPGIIEAFQEIKRVDFLPEDMKDLSEINEALPIGFSQTISQPLVVAFMLEHLQPELGNKILDVGSGSGWTTALLANIVGEKGKVFAIEIVPELKEFGERNISRYNFIEKGIAKFIVADGSKGYREEAPFDRILTSASAREVPQAWKEQLKIGGRIVAPIGSSIWLLIKESENSFKEVEYPGFTFVPLIEEKN
ncbi:MAG TPA: protein-L-isoaspartate O-methyltransferase [Candidatus Nealsonbacteria bacterium]|uniref:protein-L-isoaspartate(D-aspartate) O-methyltransferase n=1 Tax=marine sediment metagenome TaxID=412755 RepID=A0A0F9X7S2_9ZZZZ|nr:protein-L-isoaspartate O-methyltransferase [Candidatus Nealsonbacteria bacterium]HEB46593.1 protein-L-isoaspartate O-methyltransferase [Candidatus Nealsonbacteria bacterium]